MTADEPRQTDARTLASRLAERMLGDIFRGDLYPHSQIERADLSRRCEAEAIAPRRRQPSVRGEHPRDADTACELLAGRIEGAAAAVLRGSGA